MTPLYTQPDAIPVLVLLLVALAYAKAHFRDSNPGKDTVEAARDAYVQGDIPLSEFERRAELALDTEAQQIRAVVEEVPGIGPETSAAIAAEFGSVDELRAASTERLEGVAGVGEKRAADLRAYVSEG